MFYKRQDHSLDRSNLFDISVITSYIIVIESPLISDNIIYYFPTSSSSNMGMPLIFGYYSVLYSTTSTREHRAIL